MALVDRLFELPPDEREALLARTDPEVSADARKLLEADARSDELLDEPAGAVVPLALRSLHSAPRAGWLAPGARVGPFRLLTPLGEGGMGEVWVAEREGADFRQKVAIKLLHARGDAETTAARFRLERRILARLSHPGIARLLDGGTTEDGCPWLAMELVEGLSLTEHCASKNLCTEERLRLFAHVCDAVQFAHRNLVVHRDLKPSNILVQSDGEPKLLDFGIAKLLEGDPEDDRAGTLTRTGERPMTPDYAAPEQVRGEAATTATDVWALGVILHELLSGVRPYRLGSKSVGEIERAILEAAPSRPSTSTTDRALRKRLRGDLDAIVLKALRARPEDRYPSAEALATDVRRHLEGLPIAARGETAAYLLRSFVRRYRLAVGASGIGLAVVLAGLATTLWQAHRAREEARKAEQVQDFLLELLGSFDPSQHAGRPADERDILVRGEERLQTELADRPDVQAKLWRAFGRTWLNMGVFERAKPAAERAIALERVALGPRSDEEGLSLMLLGDVDGMQSNDVEGAKKAYEQACSILRETRGRDDLVAAAPCAAVGGIERAEGHFAVAERLSGDHVDLLRRVRGDRDLETLDAMADHALLLGEWGRTGEAIALYRQVVATLTDVAGLRHPETMLARYNLAHYVLESGQVDQAEKMLEEVEHDMVVVLGEGHGNLAFVLKTRARALVKLGRPEEGLALADRSIELWTRLGAVHSTNLATATESRALALQHLGKLGEAEASARQALDTHLANVGDSYVAARARSLLGSVLLDEARVPEARADLSRALAVQERVLWPGSPDTATTRAELERAGAMEGR